MDALAVVGTDDIYCTVLFTANRKIERDDIFNLGTTPSTYRRNNVEFDQSIGSRSLTESKPHTVFLGKTFDGIDGIKKKGKTYGLRFTSAWMSTTFKTSLY